MKKIYLIMIILLLILAGCWDKRYLKEHSLILAIGYDLNDDGRISKTVSFPKEITGSDGQSDNPKESENETEALTTTGNTIGDSDIELDRFLSQKFDRSKARVLLIGKKLAEHGIFPSLDSMYRDPRGPLGASVAIVSDRAESGL